MKNLLDLIEQDSTIALGMNYIQELYLQLNLLGVDSAPTFRQPLSLGGRGPVLKGLSAWQNIPAVSCVTLRVPRAKLGVFTTLPPVELGTPFVHCYLEASSSYVGPR